MNRKWILLMLLLIITTSAAVLIFTNRSDSQISEPQETEQGTEPEVLIPDLPPVISQPTGDFKCEDLYDEIENDLDISNYCQEDSDCDYIMLGGWYVDFGCYHYINKNVDKQQFYDKMEIYKEKCSDIINKCALAPDATCVSNKCVYIEEVKI